MERISTMDYYVKEIQIGDGVKKTAGIKARDDLYSIMQSLNMNEIEIPSQENKRNSKSIIGKMKEHFSLNIPLDFLIFLYCQFGRTNLKE